MTKDEERRAALMGQQMLSERGIAELARLGVYKALIVALSLQDLEQLQNNHIYFNPIFSPASKTDLNRNLENGSKIITIDINSLREYTIDEGVAVILHEIGHALNPGLIGEQGEYAADDYATTRNYGDAIISSLEKGMVKRPEMFKPEITQKRINRLR